MLLAYIFRARQMWAISRVTGQYYVDGLKIHWGVKATNDLPLFSLSLFLLFSFRLCNGKLSGYYIVDLYIYTYSVISTLLFNLLVYVYI